MSKIAGCFTSGQDKRNRALRASPGREMHKAA